jgi:tetratricopeptide (TPR) repeat protein
LFAPAHALRFRSAALRSRARRTASTLGLVCTLLASGCSELRARSHARAGNELYRAGDYAAAVKEFNEAERLHPALPVVALNKGLTCRQLMTPGSRSTENERAIRCALDAFKHLRTLSPGDPRAERLYVQTLFDADRFEQLAELYGAQLRKDPSDLAAINGLIQVYSRWGRKDEVLRYMVEKADRHPDDADAQYAVGAFLYAQLAERGGGNDKATFDPRTATPGTVPPLFGVDDITGARRVQLADQGIAYLRRALAKRPGFREANVFLNLIYRQRSFAYFDRPAEWQASVDAAELYRDKAKASTDAAAADKHGQAARASGE